MLAQKAVILGLGKVIFLYGSDRLHECKDWEVVGWKDIELFINKIRSMSGDKSGI